MSGPCASSYSDCTADPEPSEDPAQSTESAPSEAAWSSSGAHMTAPGRAQHGACARPRCEAA
eukprot:11226103-Lingulodinium_polyedra.AAC.1